MLENSHASSTQSEAPFAGAIVDHVTKFVGKPAFVLHEISSVLFHLDVHVVPPTEERRFWFLFTTGMSSREMNTPYGAPSRTRAELSILLPEYWTFKREDWEREPKWFWPIRELKSAARLPHHTNSWFGWGHTFSTPNEERYSDDTKLAAMMLLRSWSLPYQAHVIRAGLTEIDLWTLWPIYPDELRFRTQNGAHAFADLIEESGVSDVIDPKRSNLMNRVGSHDFAQPTPNSADTRDMKNKITIPDIPGFETTIEPVPEGVDPMAFLQQQMDDCPLCREARARGEVPTFHSGDELAAPARRSRLAKRPRWRTMKKRR